MRKFITAIVVILSISILMMNGFAEEKKVFKWRAVCNEPEADTRVIYHKQFCDMIRKMSDGRVDITLYPGAALYPPFEWFKNTGQGVNEVALAYGAYLGGINPVFPWEAEMPTSQMRELGEIMIYFDKITSIIRPLYAKGNVYVIDKWPLPEEAFMSNVPITKAEDFKGLKIRLGCASLFPMFKKLGAAITLIPMGDVYTALKLGTLDAVESSGYGGNWRVGLHEVTKYMIEPAPHTSLGWAGSGVHAVNMDAWNSLPDDLKEILRVASRAHALNVYKGCLEDDLIARGKMIDYGLKVLTITPEEFAKIVKASEESIQEFAKKNETAEKLVKAFTDSLDLYSKRTGFAR